MVFNALMTSKSENAYDCVLQFFKSLIDCENVESLLTDYETALRKSALKVMPNAEYAGCSVHYDRVSFIK